MKAFNRSVCVLSFMLAFFASPAMPVFSQEDKNLDKAVAEAASYLINRIHNGAKVAMVSFKTPSGRLSDYIFEELWKRFEDSHQFIMFDSRNLDRIDAEINYQPGFGRADDYQAVYVTHQYNADIIVYGKMTPIGVAPLGAGYRLTVYSTDAEKIASSHYTAMVRPDSLLSALLLSSPTDEVDRAVSIMARAVGQKITVAMGRISHAETGSISSLSVWLKDRVMLSAGRHRDKFRMASESELGGFTALSRGFTTIVPPYSRVQAVITGKYTPLDSGAEVLLQLISTAGKRVVFASSRFYISDFELRRRGLSLLPEKGSAVISAAEYELKQQVAEPYSGENNQWTFAVFTDALDGIYRDRQQMYLHIYSASDCYFRIVHVDANGNTQIIYPVSPNDDNFIRSGQTLRIPAGARFRMGPPFGEELILAAAYDKPFALSSFSSAAPLNGETLKRSFTVMDNDFSEMSPSATAKFSYLILPR